MELDHTSLVTTKMIDSKLEEEEFFYYLYQKSREQEVAQWGWSEREREAFLSMQYKFQCQSYHWQYPKLEAMIIYYKDDPIGRMMITRDHDELRLIDIIILSDYQGRGFGTQLILGLQSEARDKNVPLGLSVHVNNTEACKLYQSLGFQKVSNDEAYIRLRWVATSEIQSNEMK